MAFSKAPGIRKDGGPDGRGRSEGSQKTWYAHDDGRRRPGRSKGALSLATIYRIAGGAVVTMTLQNGKTKRISKAEGIVLKQLELALKGNLRAAEYFLEKYEQYSPVEVQPDATALKMLEDEQILGILAGADQRGLLGPTEPTVSDGGGVEPPDELDISHQDESE